MKGCKSGPSNFKFPDDPELREQWKRNIDRPDLEITSYSTVCIKHFDPDVIIRSDTFHTMGGKVIEIPRGIPRLMVGACPIPISPPEASQVENIYAKPKQPVNRKDPEVRKTEIQQRQLQELTRKREERIAAIRAEIRALEADRIMGFEAFKSDLSSKNIDPFFAVLKESYVIFFKLDDDNFFSVPAAKVFFKVNNQFDVSVFLDNEMVATSSFTHILGEGLKCNEWSKFTGLVKCLGSYDCRNDNESKIVLYVEDIPDSIENV